MSDARPGKPSPPPGPLLVDIAGTDLTAQDRELLAHPAVGGAILFSRNYTDYDQLAALTAAMRRARDNLLIVADTEGGRVQRFRDGFTPIPAMANLGARLARERAGTLAAAREIGWLMATELGRSGVDMPLAPVADIDYGRSPVIGDRAFAADGQTVAALAGAFSQGLVAAGSAATAKHFPGHGYAAADSHDQLPVDERGSNALAADRAPYRALIAAGLDSIMAAHVRYPAVDVLPASLSPRWIGDILRGEMGFTGCVFCDDLSMGAAAAMGDYEQRARLALAAGCDYLPVCNNRGAVEAVVDRVAIGGGAGTPRRLRLHAAVCRTRRTHQVGALAANRRWRAARAAIERIAGRPGGNQGQA